MIYCDYCKNSLVEIDHKCINCGCPQIFEPADEKRWNKDKGYFEPRKPSVSLDKSKRVSKSSDEWESADTLVHCSQCNLLMYLGERECPHCSYVYTTAEIIQLQNRHRSQSNYGVVYGALTTIILLLLFLYILAR